MELKQLTQELRKKTGLGMNDCKNAIIRCEGDINVAEEYLSLKSSPVSRYKLINGQKIPWTDKDFIEEAKSNIENSQDFEREL